MLGTNPGSDKPLMHSPIPSPSPRRLLPPLLVSLPAAAVSSQPPEAILPLLSPILRQRVKYLSQATEDAWLPLLCYDQAKVSNLMQIAASEKFEPHPLSGDVEVDWDSKVETRYRRIDEETLQALVNLQEVGLRVKLVWCIGDQEGGGTGWRIGETTVLDSTPAIGRGPQEGWESIEEAERRFKEATVQNTNKRSSDGGTDGTNGTNDRSVHTEQSDDDDSYWARYDNSPGRTPAPDSSRDSPRNGTKDQGDEEMYYAQYAQVQPAMDSHDPDEAARNRDVETTLGKDETLRSLHRSLEYHPELSESSQAWIEESPNSQPQPHTDSDLHLIQPRPASSGSSTGEDTVAKLEKTAATQGQNEIAVKQHISTTMKSLFRLARAAGIARCEFERLVKTELDVLSLIEEDD
jgi:hypothetical protein